MTKVFALFVVVCIREACLKSFKNAVLLPADRPKSLVGRFVTPYGMYDSNGDPIKGTPIFTSVKSTMPYQPRRSAYEIEQTFDQKMIYGGSIIGWFGHFITESVPHLIAAASVRKHHPDAKIIAHTWGKFDQEEWKKRFSEHLVYFLNKLGMTPDDIHFVLNPVRVQELIVPEPAFHTKFLCKKWILEEVDALWPAGGTFERIYFSRTQVEKSRLANEVEVEKLFAQNGFEIVHPQNYSLDEQIKMVRGAEILAGPQGSALHWSLYSNTCQSVLSLGYPSLLQRGICFSRGQEYSELRGKRPRNAERRVREVSTPQLKKALIKLS